MPLKTTHILLFQKDSQQVHQERSGLTAQDNCLGIISAAWWLDLVTLLSPGGPQ